MKITFSVPAQNDVEHLEADEWYDKLVAEINEYTNMDVTYEWVASAAYFDQLAEKIKAGNVADVVVGPTKADDPVVLAAAREGLFWDIAPYIDEYDNLAAVSDAIWTGMSDNGAIYFLPRTRNIGRNGFGYRQDWAEKLGLKISDPMTWQEFKDMLYAFTYNDPDGNGKADTQGLIVDSWHGAFEIIMAWFNVPTNWGLDKNGDLIYYVETQEYKNAIKEIRELYAQGVINDGSVEGIPVYTDLGPGSIRKDYVSGGKAGVYIQCLDDVRKGETGGGGLLEQGFGTDDKPAIRLESFVDTGNGTHVRPFGTGINGTILISTVNIKTEDQLKRVLGYLNDINDGKMVELMDYGWEGKTYEINADGYVDLWVPAGGNDEAAAKLAAAGVSSTNYRMGFNQIRTLVTAPENAQTITTPPASTEITKREQYLLNEWNPQYTIADMGAGYKSETWMDTTTQEALNKIILDAETAYIKGEVDENAIDDAIARWKAAGGDQVTKEMNELYHAAGN